LNRVVRWVDLAPVLLGQLLHAASQACGAIHSAWIGAGIVCHDPSYE
jgi:hypothetical protein